MFNKGKIAEVEALLQDARTKNLKLQNECNELSVEKVELQKKLDAAIEQANDLQVAQQDALQKMTELENVISSQERELQQKNQALSKQQEQVERAASDRARVDELSKEVTQLKELLASKDLEIEKEKNKTLDRVISELKATAYSNGI